MEFGRSLPVYAPSAMEDILVGTQLLRRAFLETPSLSASRGDVIIAVGGTEPPTLLIHCGLAYRSTSLPDGQRAITEILLQRDIVGAEHAAVGQSDREIIAASTLCYRLLKAARMRELMHDPRIALRMIALAAEARLRTERHLTEVISYDARGRIAGMIYGIYERLRHQELIQRPTFNLPLTQDQIADHLGLTMVHISRTLRRMRDEKLLFVYRGVVIIHDVGELRRAASGYPPASARQPVQGDREPVG
jgi:CRP-like cAMP-binding protein